MSFKIYLGIALLSVSVSFVLGRYVFYQDNRSVIIFNPSPVSFDLENTTAQGPQDAPITIVEFSDLECPHSITAHGRINKLLNLKKYNGKIKYYFKSFPLQMHKQAPLLAKAVLAAGLQGKSQEMRERLIKHLSKSRAKNDSKYQELISQTVKELGLDGRKLQEDIASENISTLLAKEITDGKKHDVHALPTVFINGQLLAGTKSIDTYKAIIDKLLLS